MNIQQAYDILNINKDISDQDLKKQFRRLSLQTHPDKNNNSPESNAKFTKICDAYKLLIEYRGNIKNNKGIGSEMDMDIDTDMNNISNSSNINLNSLSELLNKISLNNNPLELENKVNLPIPIIKKINITLQQSYTGCMLPIDVERWILINNTKQFETETIYVNIPPGTDNNEMIICSKKGNIISETNISDVKVLVTLIPHDTFQRIGLDLLYTQELTLKQAICGFMFKLYHLDGSNYTVSSSEGSVIQSNSERIIPNYGFNRDNFTGNLIIKFIVKLPETSDPRLIDVLKSID